MRNVAIVLSLCVGMLSAISCSASNKTTQSNLPKDNPAVTTPTATTTYINDDLCAKKWGQGQDSIDNITLYSLYREDLKIKQYESAFANWEKFIARAPGARKTPFLDGEKMLKRYLDESFTEEKFQQLMNLFDTRIACHGEEGFVLGKKGLAVASYKPENVSEISSILRESIDERGSDTYFDVIKKYFATQYIESKKGTLGQSEMIDIYDEMTEICNYNIKNNTKNASKYAEVKGYMDEKMGGVVTDCSGIIEFKGKAYRENPNDIAAINQFYDDLRNCKTDPLYMELLRKKHTMDPSTTTTKTLLNQSISSKDYDGAIRYYEQLITLDPTNNADYLLKIALMHKKKGSYATARTKANEAAAARPGWGKPFILIGDLYASSRSKCSGGKFKGAEVYWAAVDMYSKAKSDPATAADAQSRMNKYWGAFPTKEELFFQNVKEGSSTSIGCWIGGSTTVRASD